MLAITQLCESTSPSLTSENSVAHKNIWGSQFWKETVKVPPENLFFFFVGKSTVLAFEKARGIGKNLEHGQRSMSNSKKSIRTLMRFYPVGSSRPEFALCLLLILFLLGFLPKVCYLVFGESSCFKTARREVGPSA